MDRSIRRKASSSRRSSTKNASEEVNGNNPGGSGYKVESQRRKQTKDYYNNEDNECGNIYPNYMPMHGQRLFTAMSDPAVCGYPYGSLGYRYNHIPVPLGHPMYHPPPYPHRVPCEDPMHCGRRPRPKTIQVRSNQSKDTFQTVDEYTSLPPRNLHDFESDQQRRFSDPGLAKNTDTEEDSLSQDGSSASSFEEKRISNQIEALSEENKLLTKVLKDTQIELQDLKFEVASLKEMQSSYEPGFITDLVREVHEASKIREEALQAKLRAFTENFNRSQPSSVVTATVDSNRECSKECEETKEQLKTVNLEKDELTKRLARLEEQMQTILDHNRIHETQREELLESQKENLQLQQDLKTAVEARNVAETNANKYERLFMSITKKLPNGLVVEDKALSPAASLETSESLSSSLGSESLHSPQVTMSGPVTDL